MFLILLALSQYDAMANLVVIEAFSAKDKEMYCIVTPWECRIAMVIDAM